MRRDPYALLGASPDASAAELKAAWRRAVLRAHPDRPGGSPEAFRAVQSAYEEAQAGLRRGRADRPAEGQWEASGCLDRIWEVLRPHAENIDLRRSVDPAASTWTIRSVSAHVVLAPQGLAVTVEGATELRAWDRVRVGTVEWVIDALLGVPEGACP